MKYILLFTSLILISGCGGNNTNSPSISKNVEGYPENSEVLEYPDTPGVTKATLKVANNVHQEGDYLNGKKNGSWTEYHGNGVVKSITTFVTGLKQGIEITMDDRGNLLSKKYYHKDMLDGESLQYKRGKIVEKKTYQNGMLTGLVSKYYDNGRIMEESNYTNGKIDGNAKWYDQEGNVTLEYEYSNGEFVKKIE